MNHDSLLNDFRAQFGAEASHLFFSPGRVNLLGDHTDYNGGYVLPAAIHLGTYFAVRANNSNTINAISESFDGMVSIPLAAMDRLQASGGWTDYLEGTLLEFDKRGAIGGGLDILVAGDLPQSSGLSSSASLTVGIAILLNELWDRGIDKVALVRLAQDVENLYVGLQCGIMDQFAVMMGLAGHAVFLHCDSLEFDLVPVPTNGYEWLITDSRVPRKLSRSAYNQRREECNAALAVLRDSRDLGTLSGATADQVESCVALRELPVAHKRARHVVSENERVRASCEALRKGDFERFGELMVTSHESLREDYEVSCAELDILVDAAMSVPGVLGSRMTGAGFGGCTVSLVTADAVPDFVRTVEESYRASTPYEARIIRCTTADGARCLDKLG